MDRRSGLAVMAALVVAMTASPALGDVRIVRGQFTDLVEAGRPVGDAASLGSARNAVYWVEVNNPSAAVTLTFVWRIDGREVQRQTLDIGRGPRWRTWVMRRLPSSARTVEIQVLDASGTQIHTDTWRRAGH